MKNVIFLFIALNIFGCKEKTELKINKNVSKECNLIEDTITLNFNEPYFDTNSLETIKKLNGFKKIKIKPVYSADSIIHHDFKINNNKIRITIDSCVYHKNKYINTFKVNSNQFLKSIIFVKDSVHFGFDNLAIDYNRSEFYTKGDNFLLIKSYAERNVGKASNWGFNQLIDFKNKKVYEFYLYDFEN